MAETKQVKSKKVVKSVRSTAKPTKMPKIQDPEGYPAYREKKAKK